MQRDQIKPPTLCVWSGIIWPFRGCRETSRLHVRVLPGCSTVSYARSPPTIPTQPTDDMALHHVNALEESFGFLFARSMSGSRFPTGALLRGISNCWAIPTGGCDNSVPTDCKDCCGRTQTSKVQESRQRTVLSDWSIKWRPFSYQRA